MWFRRIYIRFVLKKYKVLKKRERDLDLLHVMKDWACPEQLYTHTHNSHLVIISDDHAPGPVIITGQEFVQSQVLPSLEEISG
jgi:hypothetical protein